MGVNLYLTGGRSCVSPASTVVAPQHITTRRKHAPEQRLMIAVLQDAIDCVEKYRSATDPQGRRDFDEVTQWLLAEETRWLFSFQCICDVLGLDANAVRNHLRLQPARQPVRVSREIHIARRESCDR